MSTHPTASDETLIRYEDLPVPRIQYRWEHQPDGHPLFRGQTDVKFVTVCREEHVKEIPDDMLHNFDVPPHTKPVWTIEMRNTWYPTRGESKGPCVDPDTGEAFPHLPKRREAVIEGLDHLPMFVIGPNGEVWEYVVEE